MTAQPPGPWQDVPVLVTGGAGFIGSHLVDALVAAGARVRVLDDLSSGRRENLAQHLAATRPQAVPAGHPAPIELIDGDLRDVGVCQHAASGVRYVFHQAARSSVPASLEDPATTIAVNVAGSANLFTAARDAGVDRVIYASSSSVYGDSARLPAREGEEGRPLSPYALSKRQGEELAALFARSFGLELVGLRYFNVYGPRQDPAGPYAAVVPRFLAAYAAGRAPQIYGDGEQARDFLHVADAVTANLAAALAPRDACGRAYNVGAGQATTVRELAAMVQKVFGGGPDPVHLPPRAGEVRLSLADLGAARAALGLGTPTDLRTGLARTAADLGLVPAG